MAVVEHAVGKPKVVLKGGASFVGCKPIFTADSKYLLVVSGFNIKVVAVKSGECVRELKGHKAKITSICLNRSNPYQVFSCSYDHTVIKWDFTDGAVLKRFRCPGRLHAMIPTSLEEPEFIGISQIRKEEGQVVSFSMPKQEKEIVFTLLEKRLRNADNVVSFGCQDDIVAYIHAHQLTVLSLKTHQRKVHRVEVHDNRYSEESILTTVCCHPIEPCIATGTKKGIIYLWYNFLSKKKVVKNMIHWHALPVRSLTFTTEGSYLLSGGHECVLVKWQQGSNHRDTLPRLGAPIINIASSPDNLLYATAHSDNSIQVISSQFKVVQILSGLTQAHLDEAQPEDRRQHKGQAHCVQGTVTHQTDVGLLLDPQTAALVLNGRPGHLQFYSLHADKQLYCLDIVGQNYITPENLQRPLVVTQLVRAAFSTSGRWLVTVEWRDDGETTIEQRLKFWLYDAKQRTYTLNTCVETPHTKQIHTLRFRPTSVMDEVPCVVTASTDGRFKIWQVVDDSDIYRRSTCWSCESVGFYRDEPAGSADFAEDGSLLAVAFNSTLTLWDPDRNGLQQTFSLKDTIREVLFGSGASSHLLAVTDRRSLSVFELLTCSVLWSLEVEVSVMCLHQQTGLVATIDASSRLQVYDLSRPEPVYTHTSLSPHSSVRAALFVPHQKQAPQSPNQKLPWQHLSQFYFINREQELLTLTEETETETERVRVAESVPETPLSVLLSSSSKSARQDTQRRHEDQHGVPGAQYLKELLHTPAHVLPPVSTLCASFLQSLLVTKKSDKQAENEEDPSDSEEEEEEEDVNEESDMEVESKPSSQQTLIPEEKPVPSDSTQAPQSEEPALSQIKPKTLAWVQTL